MIPILAGLLGGALLVYIGCLTATLTARHQTTHATTNTEPPDDTQPGPLNDTYHHLEHLYNAPAAEWRQP